MTVSDHHVAQFRQDGFLRGPCVLEGQRLAAVRDAVEALVDRTSDGLTKVMMYRGSNSAESMVHVVGAWLAEEPLAALVHDPVITAWVCRLMDTERVRLFRDQVFVKPPGSTTNVPWHQDYSDWVHTVPASHITCWIPLDEVTRSSGCLQYIPGTHTGMRLPKITSADDFESTMRWLPDDLPPPVPVELPAGHCVFHHCLTVHGSAENTTSHTRRAIAIAFMHPDTRSVTADRRSIPNGPTFAPGTRLEGELFPLVGAGVR